ncbi:hypothetical protein PEC18_29650 [Paucibacter sp. O1-1]|nr:hypothetical protein [Paucibacter sp. O1-1]MDA3829906.1 hypothetical protein [Paucibacter sp. O1-1]
MSDKQGGLPGYRGFEYQIDASIWIALDLMLYKEQISEMLVEPDNSEDVEVSLKAPSDLPAEPVSQDSQAATAHVTASTGRRMLYQMKTRSTGPWTASAFQNVIGDGLEPQKPARGSTPRARALRMLLNDSNLSYMLLTDAGTDANLFKLSWPTLHPEGCVAVPSRDFFDKNLRNQAGKLAGRLLIMPSLQLGAARLPNRQALDGNCQGPPCTTRTVRCRAQRRLPSAPIGHRARTIQARRASDGSQNL